MSAHAKPSTAISCRSCVHFETDRAIIEAMLFGLTVLGSAYGSVAADDGICRLHDTFQSCRFLCAAYNLDIRTIVVGTVEGG
jgi:hypothetical protein